MHFALGPGHSNPPDPPGAAWRRRPAATKTALATPSWSGQHPPPAWQPLPGVCRCSGACGGAAAARASPRGRAWQLPPRRVGVPPPPPSPRHNPGFPRPRCRAREPSIASPRRCCAVCLPAGRPWCPKTTTTYPQRRWVLPGSGVGVGQRPGRCLTGGHAAAAAPSPVQHVPGVQQRTADRAR
jgi:hypothetical protein